MMGREDLIPSFICGISHLCERRPRRLAVGRCVSHARAANDRKVPHCRLSTTDNAARCNRCPVRGSCTVATGVLANGSSGPFAANCTTSVNSRFSAKLQVCFETKLTASILSEFPVAVWVRQSRSALSRPWSGSPLPQRGFPIPDLHGTAQHRPGPRGPQCGTWCEFAAFEQDAAFVRIADFHQQ